jgi:transaldolase
MPDNSLLDQLKKMTVVVADTGDFQSISRYKPRDATTNPSLIASAAQMPDYQFLVDETLINAKKLTQSSDPSEVIGVAFDNLAVQFGIKILEAVPGRVSTEVDARLSWDTDATVTKAESIIEQYDRAGVDTSRVLIKIASTWEGIKAAEILEKRGIHCNLTLLFGLHQAAACADAGVTLISPFVGRILDWYQKNTGKEFQPHEDPGVVSVTSIYNYFKKFGYKTQIMGASFRNVGEIMELAGCDLLTISPALLESLATQSGRLEQRLSEDKAQASEFSHIEISQESFDTMHTQNLMASQKLEEGIQGFTKALEATEHLLLSRLKTLEQGTEIGNYSDRLFGQFDLDHDGFLCREEWLGTDAVFDALDTDKDGKVSLGELRSGLGALIKVGCI